MGAVAGRALGTLRKFNAQDLANTVWAFAKLRVMESALMGAVAEGGLYQLVPLGGWVPVGFGDPGSYSTSCSKIISMPPGLQVCP